MQPEADLLQTTHLDRLRSRDRGAIHAEYRAHGAVLIRAARRLGFTSIEADELAQAVWATFLEIVPRFEARSQVRTFLLGILRREAAAMRRRSARTTPVDPISLSQLGAGRSDSEFEANELERVVNDCVGSLDAKARDAVELRLLESKETRDVAQRLGVTANYLGVLLHRARAHLRHCIEEHFA